MYHLCSLEDRSMSKGWANTHSIFIFEWTNPLKRISRLLSLFMKQPYVHRGCLSTSVNSPPPVSVMHRSKINLHLKCISHWTSTLMLEEQKLFISSAPISASSRSLLIDKFISLPMQWYKIGADQQIKSTKTSAEGPIPLLGLGFIRPHPHKVPPMPGSSRHFWNCPSCSVWEKTMGNLLYHSLKSYDKCTRLQRACSLAMCVNGQQQSWILHCFSTDTFPTVTRYSTVSLHGHIFSQLLVRSCCCWTTVNCNRQLKIENAHW